MALAYFTLRPDFLRVDQGYSIAGGAASEVAATSDNSDTTYVYKTTTFSSPLLRMNNSNPSPDQPAAGRFVYYVKAQLRASGTAGTYGGPAFTLGCGYGIPSNAETTYFSSGYNNLTVPATITTVSTGVRAAGGITTITTAAAHGRAVGDMIWITGSSTGTPSGFVNGMWRILTVPTTTQFTFQHTTTTASTGNATNGNVSLAANVSANPQYTDPNGYAWTSGVLNASYIEVTDSSASGNNPIYELWADVVTATIPTVTITSIDGDTAAPFTVTNTTRPTIQWAYAQAESIGQTAYEVKLFATDPTASGAETATALWSISGTGSTNTAQIQYDMLNGSTYYAYVKVGTGGASTASGSNYSTWVGAGAIAVTLTAPTRPTIGTPTWSTSNQRATISITGGAAFAAGTQVWQCQRSDDGGTSWAYVRGADSFNLTAATVAPTAATIYDYEPKRGGTNPQYRVRAVGTVGGAILASAWTASPVSVSVAAVTNWNMIAFSATGISGTLLSDVKVLGDLQLDQAENVGVFRPRGRSKPIVIHGNINGEDGTYEIFASTIAIRDSILTLVNSQLVVLVLDPFGEQKYVHFTGRSILQTGPAAAPRFYISANYVETESGLVTD